MIVKGIDIEPPFGGLFILGQCLLFYEDWPRFVMWVDFWLLPPTLVNVSDMLVSLYITPGSSIQKPYLATMRGILQGNRIMVYVRRKSMNLTH